MSFRRCRLTWNPSLTYQLYGQIYLKLRYFEARKFTRDKQMTSSFPYISLQRSPQQPFVCQNSNECLPTYHRLLETMFHLRGFCVYTFLVDVTSYIQERQLKKYFRLPGTVPWNHINVFCWLHCFVFEIRYHCFVVRLLQMYIFTHTHATLELYN